MALHTGGTLRSELPYNAKHMRIACGGHLCETIGRHDQSHKWTPRAMSRGAFCYAGCLHVALAVVVHVYLECHRTRLD
jgi:hypothetical protein